MRQVNRGLPFVHRFTASATNTVTLRGPDDAKTNTAPVPVQDGSTHRYTVVLTPDELGIWTFTCEDGSSNVTHEAHFDCVKSTDREISLGISNSYESLVEVYPQKIITLPITTNTNAMTAAAGNKYQWLNYGKCVIPWDGYIYGVEIYSKEDIADADSVKLFTATGTGTSYVVRSFSDDFKAIVPDEGAWTSSWAWQTVKFTKPVLARQGDLFGVEVDATGAGGSVQCIRNAGINTSSEDAQDVYAEANETLAIGSSYVGGITANNATLCVAPLMHPPPIALAGHSFWASHSASDESHSPYEDSDTVYDADNDMAAMISDGLGVPVVPIADGGTNIGQWVGEDGLLEVNAGQVRPAVLLYDSVYNDAANYTVAEYEGYLDRLLAHCDELSIELVMLESPHSTYARVTSGTYTTIAGMNREVREWCAKSGVAYIPLNWRLNRTYTTGSDDTSTRYVYYDGADAGLSDYGESGSAIHPSKAGRIACANAVVQTFRARRGDAALIEALSNDSSFGQSSSDSCRRTWHGG